VHQHARHLDDQPVVVAPCFRIAFRFEQANPSDPRAFGNLRACIATSAMMTGMQGREGEVLARTFKHSFVLTFLPGLLVMARQCLFPSFIPR
jgi:hypothetical protein